MLSFKDITLDDKDLIQSYTLNSDRMNCDLSFSNLCSWKFLYQTKYAISENMLIFRFYIGEQLAYIMPIGNGDIKKTIRQLMEDAADIGSDFIIVGINNDAKKIIEQLFPNRFDFTSERDFSDYIYLRSDLALLKGRKYQAKRNHINKFKSLYPDYRYLKLTPELVPECLKLEEIWCKANNCEERAELAAERQSLTFALNNMEQLGITGGTLLVNDKIVAFTYGDIINNEVWDVCVEKADTSIEGVYTIINNEYINSLPDNFIYINREEDLGIEGLRKAKLSYHPSFILEKYIAKLN